MYVLAFAQIVRTCMGGLKKGRALLEPLCPKFNGDQLRPLKKTPISYIPVMNGSGEFREIFHLFKSGVISSYVRKFKTLIGNIRQQPDAMSKVMTFVVGIVEVFKV